ncbi:ATP-dependent sacrificial sulfur transferase LarE [Photobacterium sp. DA100]|uniref:ATP-dependent sacrificial sulfur transferase LarE n=1 Tax=Photobacterium sp. DA100 TaxID=3027472 RepID=UPI00247A03FD|nr:ATP-dependent sacrificial sulfur transferase LarE [Photobacterium sp. DA100]WEM41182.1 ATP-dependent sacrificial sulfur transferase LarE [Photobacterium sp. DA100]
MTVIDKIQALETVLQQIGKVTVAVSGGVDSMTLAYVAHQTLGDKAKMVHATSSAVPGADTQRIQKYAKQQGWQLELVQAGEMQNSAYRSNPVNRCYHCKSALYSTLTTIGFGQVVSGTNLDDLSDYRPGLIAAKEKAVRHPFVEADIDKSTIRLIAQHFGLSDIAFLPASPCLASRVETGVFIQPEQLDLINRVETSLRKQINAENIRCRLLAQRLVLQIDEDKLSTLHEVMINNIIADAQSMASEVGLSLPVDVAPYKRGSAFVRVA